MFVYAQEQTARTHKAVAQACGLTICRFKVLRLCTRLHNRHKHGHVQICDMGEVTCRDISSVWYIHTVGQKYDYARRVSHWLVLLRVVHTHIHKCMYICAQPVTETRHVSHIERIERIGTAFVVCMSNCQGGQYLETLVTYMPGAYLNEKVRLIMTSNNA
jgi:hypothetical protein